MTVHSSSSCSCWQSVGMLESSPEVGFLPEVQSWPRLPRCRQACSSSGCYFNRLMLKYRSKWIIIGVLSVIRRVSWYILNKKCTQVPCRSFIRIFVKNRRFTWLHLFAQLRNRMARLKFFMFPFLLLFYMMNLKKFLDYSKPKYLWLLHSKSYPW